MRHLADTYHLSKEAYLRKTPKNGKSRAEQVASRAGPVCPAGIPLVAHGSPVASYVVAGDQLHGASAEAHGVALQFAPADGPAFFDRYGWETEEYLSCVEEARRLDRWFLSQELLSAPLSTEQWDLVQRLFTVVKLKRADRQDDNESHTGSSGNGLLPYVE